MKQNIRKVSLLGLVVLLAVLSGCAGSNSPEPGLPTLAPTVGQETNAPEETAANVEEQQEPQSGPPPTFTRASVAAVEPSATQPPTSAPEQLPTATPQPTAVTVPTDTPVPPVSVSAVGTVRVDHWIFEISEVISDPGMDAGRQSLILLGYLTNDGTQTDTFTALYTMVLRDSQGRLYEEESRVTWAAQDKYGAEIAASISPGAREYIAVGFDVPSSERSFTLVPGSLASSWGGDVSFTIPGSADTQPTEAPAAGGAVGTVVVDHWRFEITEVRSDPGMDANRQSLILLGYLTNEGTQTDTFTALYTLNVQDSQGRLYEEENRVTWAAQDKYGAEIAASISPGAREYIAVGFDVPSSERSFTLVPGSLASSWGGNVSITVP